jgi:hypothetical protein
MAQTTATRPRRGEEPYGECFGVREICSYYLLGALRTCEHREERTAKRVLGGPIHEDVQNIG